MTSHSMWAMPKGGVIWDVSPVPLGSKEFRDPPTVKKSLHSIMNEHKMSEMRV